MSELSAGPTLSITTTNAGFGQNLTLIEPAVIIRSERNPYTWSKNGKGYIDWQGWFRATCEIAPIAQPRLAGMRCFSLVPQGSD